MKKPFAAARLVSQHISTSQIVCQLRAESSKITLPTTFKTFCTIFATDSLNLKNKMSMKRFLISAIVSLVAVAAVAHERMIPYAELPQKARTFIEQYFQRDKVIAIEMDNDRHTEYKVRFADGCKLSFDGNGEWTEVDMSQGEVPSAVVPEAVAKQVAVSFPNATIVQIERRGGGYEVELSDDREMIFDAAGNVIKVDD